MPIGCVIRQPPPSFDQIDCIANVPVAKTTFADAPSPLRSQAHLSPDSYPSLSYHPRSAWSVSVSAYSWPATRLTPSRAPDGPLFTKFAPQPPSASGTYGMFEKARLPLLVDVTLCHAQKPPPAMYPSGCVPDGAAMTYCTERFEFAVVFPKCKLAASASFAICPWLVAVGIGAALSTQTPASAPPVGYPTASRRSGTWCCPRRRLRSIGS